MRKIAEAIFSIFWQSDETDDQELAIVNDYHNHYKQIDTILLSRAALFNRREHR